MVYDFQWELLNILSKSDGGTINEFVENLNRRFGGSTIAFRGMPLESYKKGSKDWFYLIVDNVTFSSFEHNGKYKIIAHTAFGNGFVIHPSYGLQTKSEE